tara:strand:- start:15994 stop:16317 length:324 start_codon:yes stop_codon:yes gene_type:complete
MSKIKKEHFIKGLVRQNVKKGNAKITIISINVNELPINEQGWTNIGIQKKKDGTQFMFSYDDYIKDQKNPIELLKDIVDKDYESGGHIKIVPEDYELESRKHENWNK